jgi:hypothetical protein
MLTGFSERKSRHPVLLGAENITSTDGFDTGIFSAASIRDADSTPISEPSKSSD